MLLFTHGAKAVFKHFCALLFASFVKYAERPINRCRKLGFEQGTTFVKYVKISYDTCTKEKVTRIYIFGPSDGQM